jgi:hypothetical protein
LIDREVCGLWMGKVERIGKVGGVGVGLGEGWMDGGKIGRVGVWCWVGQRTVFRLCIYTFTCWIYNE